MAESTQHKLDRVRSPRVQITYDVETGGAIVKTELPLIVGVIADLSSSQEAKDGKPFKEYKDRPFVEIDRDNFDDVLTNANPTLHLSSKEAGDVDVASAAVFPVDLQFTKLDDFKPFEIVQRVGQLRELYDARTRLADLAAKLDGNSKLSEALKSKVEILKTLPAIAAAPAASTPATPPTPATEPTDSK